MTDDASLAHAAAIFKRLGDAYDRQTWIPGTWQPLTLEQLERLLMHVTAEYAAGVGL